MKYNRKVRGTPDAMQVIFIGDSYGTESSSTKKPHRTGQDLQ